MMLYGETYYGFKILITSTQGKNMIEKWTSYHGYRNPIIIMQFAEFLGIEEQVKEAIGNYYKNVPTESRIQQLIKSGYIYFPKHIEEMSERLKKAMEEYSQTQSEFYATEATKKQNAQSKKSKRISFVEQLQLEQKNLETIEPQGQVSTGIAKKRDETQIGK